jgi:Ca2+-binding EF-hand superfamily protein
MEFVAVSGRFFNTSFEAKLKLVFDIYDVDSDGFISESDIRGILSHIPLEVIVNVLLILDFVWSVRTS